MLMNNIVRPDILHLEACNFIDKPMGGQLNFSRQLLKVFGDRIALVGWASNGSEPVGCWYNKKIDGTVYKYFAIGRDRASDKKPFLPARFITWLQIKKNHNKIFSIGVPNVLVREHSILMGMKNTHEFNVCFYFPGVNSPLSISRYNWAKRFSTIFDQLFFNQLPRKADLILAAADTEAIAELKLKAGAALKGTEIMPFPTRVDTSIFHPDDRFNARKKLGLPTDKIIATVSGRIHWAKGWSFLLDSFFLFNKRCPNSLFIFLGDGAERMALKQKALSLGLEKKILLAGHNPPEKVAIYLQSSDLFVMGSRKEGWSTALVEALACHIPIVTTRVSSSEAIVKEGVNGFIVERDAALFATHMEKAQTLENTSEYCEKAIANYALNNLETDLLQVWPLVGHREVKNGTPC
jgi:glycosyltransferase involved in cell wall biosynthesis